MIHLGLRRWSGAQRRFAFRTPAAATAGNGNATWTGSEGDKPKIYIIHDEEHYVQPLLREMTKRGVAFEEWNLTAAMPSRYFDMSRIPPRGVFYNRISALGSSEHKDAPQLARGLLMWLQTHRRHIVNGPQSLANAASKMETQIALQLGNLRTPRSIACFNDLQILEAARVFQGKFVLEPNRRMRSRGAVPFHTIAELEEYLSSGKFVCSADNITIVQEFIKSAAPYVCRAEFVGRRLLYGMHVDVTRGWDNLVPGSAEDLDWAQQSGEVSEDDLAPVPRYQVFPDFDHPILHKYKEFMDKQDIDIASFEFAEDAAGNTITFDIDICSTYNTAAEYRAEVPKAGINATVDYLSRLLELEMPIRGTQHARRQKLKSEPEPVIAPPVVHNLHETLVCDGGMGRELRVRAPDRVTTDIWSARALIDSPELVKEVHIDFIRSGAKVITSNNYACTPQFLAKGGLESELDNLTEKALRLACEARDESGVEGVRVMATLPPLNESYRADLVSSYEEMEAQYNHLVKIYAKYADILLCETMSSKEEAYAAAKAACSTGKEVWVSWTLKDDLSALLRSGDTVPEAFNMLQEFDKDIGAYLFNCSVPEAIEQALPILLKLTDKPVGAMPNCFAPIPTDWTLSGSHGFREIRADMRPIDYAGYMRGWVDKGASIVGGCCGIGPGHIQLMVEDLKDHPYSLVDPI